MAFLRQGHRIRIGISGADAKHFHVDHQGKRAMWVHTGPGTPSCLSLPVLGQ
jgi:hypothetical protein